MTQLELFMSREPGAQIFVFPTTRQVTLAHAIAQRLDDMDYASGRKHWSKLCRDLRKGLRSDGHSAVEIKSALDQLADNVHEAIRRLALQKQYRPSAVILSLTGERIETLPYGDGAGAAEALGQGTKFLVGLGEAHVEYDAARASDGGDAA